MDKEKLTKEEREAKNYEKFKTRIKRLTPYAHDKRMFSRMETERRKEAEIKKAEKVKKSAAVKKESAT